ncbi:hypothetical protein V1509DRAFT_618281 [Lipomyces kononenkoae]
MVLPSLSLSKKSPKLKASADGRFSPVTMKFSHQSVEKLPMGPSLPTYGSSPISASPSLSSSSSSPQTSESSPITVKTLSTSPLMSDFSSPTSGSFVALTTPPKSPDMPDSLVFRDLDRYPQIVRHVVTSEVEHTSLSPTSPTPGTRTFPKRESSVKAAKSLLTGSTPILPRSHITSGSAPGSKQTTTPGRFPAVPEIPEQSPTLDAESKSLDSKQSRSESAQSWCHSPVEGLSSDSASLKSISQHPKHPSQSSTTSESSTSSLPLQEAVQVRVASFSSIDSTPRKIRISGSPESKRSVDSSVPAIPIAFNDDIASSQTTFNFESQDGSDNDSMQENGRSPSKAQQLIGKTQSRLKKIHLPELQISSGTLSNLKSTISYSPRSRVIYSYDLVESLQHELREASAELASSIKRELEIEMLLDNYATTNDSECELTDGSSSYREDDSVGLDPFLNRLRYSPERFQQLETKLRNAEQEKAKLRLEFQHTIERERHDRLECEEKRKKLEEQLKSKTKSGKKDALLAANIEATENMRSLEIALEEAQRKLYNERMNAENLEFMLTSIREELQDMTDKPTAELESRARSSIASLNMLKRSPRGSLNSSHGSPEPFDPDSARARIEELEAQRDALQEALRGLKDRHALEAKRSSEQANLLHTQLNRARDLAKAIAARRVVHDKDMSFFKEQLEAVKRQLIVSQEEKAALERTYNQLKETVLGAHANIHEAESTEGEGQPTQETAQQTIPDVSPNCDEALTRIEELSQKLRRRSTEMKALSDDFEKERQETKSLIQSLEGRVAKAEEQQRKADILVEEHSVLLRTLSSNRKQLKEEHQKMTEDLDTSTRRLHDFARELQQHVASNREFASRFTESMTATTDQKFD